MRCTHLEVMKLNHGVCQHCLRSSTHHLPSNCRKESNSTRNHATFPVVRLFSWPWFPVQVKSFSPMLRCLQNFSSAGATGDVWKIAIKVFLMLQAETSEILLFHLSKRWRRSYPDRGHSQSHVLRKVLIGSVDELKMRPLPNLHSKEWDRHRQANDADRFKVKAGLTLKE